MHRKHSQQDGWGYRGVCPCVSPSQPSLAGFAPIHLLVLHRSHWPVLPGFSR